MGVDATGRAQAERYDVDLGRCDLQQPIDVVTRARGVDDDPVRAPGGERHEHAHAEPEDAEVCLRRETVSEVVDRDDAAEMSPRGRRVPEAVDEVDAGALRQRAGAAAARREPTRPGCGPGPAL